MRREPQLGRSQLEILQYIHDHHPLTVRQVADHFTRYARTTVLTVMEKLREKGYLSRKKVGGVYQYSPKVPKTQVLQALAHDFVERALEGSLAPLIAYLTKKTNISDEELQELKELVRDLDARRKARDRGSKTEDR